MFNFLKNREESNKKATQKNTQTKSNSVQKENSQGGSVGSSLKKWVNSSEEIADKDIKTKIKRKKQAVPVTVIQRLESTSIAMVVAYRNLLLWKQIEV